MTATTLRKLAPEAIPGRYGHKEVSLSRYAVIVDGKEVGQVFQHRAETMHGYSDRMYGYATERTAWGWDSEDFGGNYEFDTRREALEDFLSAAGVA